MAEVLRIKEISGQQPIRRPWFDIAAKSLDLLKRLYEADDFRASLSIDDRNEMEAILREGGWL